MSFDLMLPAVRNRLALHSASRAPSSILRIGPRPKIDIDEIVKNADRVAVNAQQRNVPGVDAHRIVGLAKERNEMINARQKLEQQRNALSKNRDTPTSDTQLAEARELKRRVQHTRQLEQRMEDMLLEECLKVPNWTHSFTPIGSEDCARLFKVIGSRKAFEPNLAALCHVELGKKLDWFDFQSASAASGSRSVFFKNEAVLLEQALIMWTIQECLKKGFVPIAPPSLVHSHALERCGFSPREADQGPPLFRIEGSDLCLSGTSEVLLAMTLYDKIIDPKSLPYKFVGINPCFRTEIGSGTAARGIFRLHQFNKVELFGASELADADALHMEVVDLQIHLCQQLGMHCRLLEMPSQELGASAFRKLDMEAWMPGKARDAYGEIMSASNCTDYQSRRLNARVKNPNETRRFVATVNGTACATPRMMIAIMEQFQNDSGVVIPEVLRPFMGGLEMVRFRT